MGKSIKVADLLTAASGGAAPIGAEVFEGYGSPLQAARAKLARTEAMLESIGRLSEMMEDSSDGEMFLMATAIQACVESAQTAIGLAETALKTIGEHRTQ